jgi:hypothetical protein
MRKRYLTELPKRAAIKNSNATESKFGRLFILKTYTRKVNLTKLKVYLTNWHR